MANELIAPSTSPISIAFAVPTTWDAVPMEMPFATLFFLSQIILIH